MDFITTTVVSSDKSQQVVLEINFSTQHVSVIFEPYAEEKVEVSKEEGKHD